MAHGPRIMAHGSRLMAKGAGLDPGPRGAPGPGGRAGPLGHEPWAFSHEPGIINH